MKKAFSGRKILIAILLLAAVLRFWNLGNVPPSASLDEASIGYNAYSVLKTGEDEYGDFPLVSQRGYDDWRRSTYLFLVMPSVALFGLNAFAVRVPAVILSILTVWAIYHIILLLFSKQSKKSEATALLTAFLLSISPWHIYISRLGHESNACLAFLVFGFLFFLQGFKNKSKFFLSLIFFTLSMISYYSGQVFIPLFVATLFLIYRKNIFKIVTSSKKTLSVFFVFAILSIPVFWAVFFPNALVRFQGTSTFKPEAHSEMYARDVVKYNESVEKGNIIKSIYYNRRLFPVKVLANGYLSHFSPKWLFLNSGSESFKVPNLGLFYLWQAPFLALGAIAFLISRQLSKSSKLVILTWFVLGALPAAIATQAPHAMRFYNGLPAWQLLIAFGLVYIFYKFQRIKILTASVFLIFICLSIGIFAKNYFVVFPREQSRSFQYALWQTLPFVISQDENYKRIVFSNQENLYQSYMFFLFYTKYDPSLYQKQGGTKSGGFAEWHKFGKYEFRPLQEIELDSSTLYISNPSEVGTSLRPIFEGKYLNGKVGIEALIKT